MTALLPDIMETRRDLEFPNPFDDTTFCAYIETPQGLLVPRAYQKALDCPLDVIDNPANIQLADGYALRDYQEPAVTEISRYFAERNHGQLLFTAVCGAGKSFSLAGLLARLNRKTLILSHLTILNTQILGELSTNLKDTSIGIITSKTTEFPDIAIASYQALASSKNLLQKCAETYSILCLDEGENCVTTSRLKVIFHLSYKYLVFMTATPSKELVKMTKAVEYIYGDKIVTMSQPEDVKVHSNHLMVDYRHLNWQSPGNSNMYKTSLGKFLLKSPIIQDMINLTVSLKHLPGCVWIVADLSVVKERCKQLLEAQGCTVAIIDSKTTTKKRAEILHDVTKGLYDVVIGSKPLSAGLSVKELLVGIRLLPSSSSEEELKQSSGRLNRFCEFKTIYTPLWIDYVVGGSLTYGAKERYKLYQQSTLKAHFCKPQEVIGRAQNLILGK